MSFAKPAGPAPARGPDAPARKLHLVESILAGRRWRDVAVDGTDVRGRLRLLTRAETATVRDACRQALAARGIATAAPGALEAFPEWREELILRTVAVAVRDAQDQPLGAVEDWAELDDVQLVALWDAYQDHEATLDPFGERGPPLSEADARAILAAAKGSGIGQLMSYGSYKLARFAISTVAPVPI